MYTKKPVKKMAAGGDVSMADKIKKHRMAAQDKSLPQDVRNVHLDRANELEQKAYEEAKKAGKAMAKGGAVKKKEDVKRGGVLSVMIGLLDAPPKKSAKKGKK